MDMKNTETTKTIEALKSMSVEERIAFLQVNRPELFTTAPRIASFGKAPKDGWKDSDRIADYSGVEHLSPRGHGDYNPDPL